MASYIFDSREVKIRQKAEKRFESEIITTNGLLFHLADRAEMLESSLAAGKKLNNVQKYGLSALSQNYNILHNALRMITTGYELEGLMLIRPAAERIFLMLYFCEFPDDLMIYHKRGHQKFYSRLRGKKYDSYLRGVIDRIEDEGKLFRHAYTKRQWPDELYVSLVDQPSKLLHFDQEVSLLASMRNGKMLLGPHLRIRSAKIVYRTIKIAALWSLLAMLIIQDDVPIFMPEAMQVRYAFKDLYGIDVLTEIDDIVSSLF